MRQWKTYLCYILVIFSNIVILTMTKQNQQTNNKSGSKSKKQKTQRASKCSSLNVYIDYSASTDYLNLVGEMNKPHFWIQNAFKKFIISSFSEFH